MIAGAGIIVLVVGLALAVLVGLGVRETDPVVAIGFAVALAIVGGAVFVGTPPGDGLRLLGAAVLLLAVVAGSAALVASVRGDR